MAAEEGVDRVDLPEGYYADNFRTVLDTVLARDADLLDGAEQSFAEAFRTASRDAQRLYVRLISRKGPCFRLDLLRYDEIDDIGAAAQELEAAGLLDRAEDAPLPDLLGPLRRPELVGLSMDLLSDPAAPGAPTGGVVDELVDRGMLRRARRSELESWLARAWERSPAEVASALRARYPLVRPLGSDHVLVFRLLFFGNLGQDLSEFVLRDLGIVRYEDYPLRRELRLFTSRQEIEHHLALRGLRHRVRELLAQDDLEAALELAGDVAARAESWHATAHRHRDRILCRVARELERRAAAEQGIDNRDLAAGEGEPSRLLDRALALYERAESPPARERRCRVLERLGRLDEALALCRGMAAAPWDESEESSALVIGRRLRRQMGLKPGGRRHRPDVVELELRADPDVHVEQLVVRHLGERGRWALHGENWLWTSFFGLAFWDIVFAPVPGAFQHPFQLAPLDFRGAAFRRARRHLVEERLEALRAEPDPVPRLRRTLEAKRGVANALVPWFDGLEMAVLTAARHVRGQDLAVVCDRMSCDPRRYRRGLPDLFVADGAGGFELWEVKGPRDQLRPEQRSWLQYFSDHGLAARVVKVRWSTRS